MINGGGMTSRQSRWLIGFGIVLLVLGAALIAYDPHAGRVTLYWKAKTGFFIASGFGLAALVCGGLIRAGRRTALWVGLALSFLAMVGFFMQAKKFFHKAGAGDPTLNYAAAVTSLMAVASFITLVNVARGVATLPPPPAGPPAA